MGDLYKIKGEKDAEYGPINPTELRSWISQNRCNSNTLVEVDGSGNWVKLGTLADFAAALGQQQPPASKGDGGVSSVIPYKNKQALIAYYLGVFCIVCANPEVKGTAHAWIGILSGTVFLLLSIGLIALILVAPK